MQKAEAEGECINYSLTIDIRFRLLHPPNVGVQGGAAPLPEQLISQPPPRPFHMPVAFMPHFIQAPPRFSIA